MSEELKPCPFCGSDKIHLIYQGSSDWTIECENCPLQASFWVHGAKYGYGDGEHQEVIKRWNTRVSPLAQVIHKLEKSMATPMDVMLQKTEADLSCALEREKKLLGLLKKCEWAGYSTYTESLYCPECLNSKDKGHTPDCALEKEDE